jgi:hypothetical protein
MLAVVSSVFHVFARISYACLKCFIYVQTYVASIGSRCFKTGSGVAHVAMRVRSGGDASGPRAWFGSARPGSAAPLGHVKPGHVGEGVLVQAWEMECSAGVRT